MLAPHLEAIMFLLNMEKHMTPELIAQALYPDDKPKTRYDRVIKQLRKLRERQLLESRWYQKKPNEEATELVYAIAKHPDNTELGYIAPSAKDWPSPSKYPHERACSQVFTKFVQKEFFGWDMHKKVPGLSQTPDRTFWLTEDLPLYIEVELQERDRVSEKMAGYQKYYRETKNPFRVLFLVQVMREWKASPHYEFQLLDDFLGK
jgi:hypothetical protein